MAGTKFVRLRDDLARGGRYDLASGWGISGYDVKEMPDEEGEPQAFAFVSGEIRAGRIEPASRAEYDEVHPDLAAALGFSPTKEDGSKPFQERAVQREARKGHTKVKAKRNAEAAVDAFEADEARRKATIAAQKGQEDRAKSKSAQKSAAEAEEEAERLNTEALRREADARSTGGGRAQVSGALPPVDDEEDDEDGDSDQYDEMNKKALVKEARSRDGVDHNGTAEELRERLRAHDAAADDDDDDDDSDDDSEDDDTDDTEGGDGSDDDSDEDESEGGSNQS
jgi:hypothetical protein